MQNMIAMRNWYTFLVCFLSMTLVNAQEVQWLAASPIGFDINPDIPQHAIASSDAGHVYVARSTTLTYLYGDVYGAAVVEQRDALGEVNWSFTLGDTVLLQHMAAGGNGRVILGGRFFRKLHLNGGAELPVLNGNEFPETFLIALDSDGNLLWQRNITPNDPQGTNVAAITFDHQGRAWYATCDFFRADIMRLDEQGNDVETRPMENAKTIGAISFDPWGGLYVSGAASNPGLSVNGTLYPLAPSYNFFVTRMDASGAAQWLQSAEDVTFQRSVVMADAYGHAYLAGTPFDSITFGGIHFHGPEWNSTFFLARLDSTGAFQWGFQPPMGAPFSGQFDLARTASLGVNAAGDAVLLGVANGLVEWGNDVVTNAGGLTDRAVTLLSLDSTGTPQWQLNGGSADHDVPQGLAVLPGGTCHIAVQVRDTFLLGPFAVETSAPTLVVARIDPAIGTGIAEPKPDAEQLTAFPSPFSTTFALAAADLAGPVQVVVRDASGRVALTSSSRVGLGSSLAPGVYLVELLQGTRRWHARVVKQ